MKKIIIYISSLLLLYSCAPGVLTTISNAEYENQRSKDVFVFDEGEAIPDESVRIGSLTVSPRPGMPIFSWSFDRMMKLVKKRARKVGGNAVSIVFHAPPSHYSPAHKFIVDIYRTSQQVRNSFDGDATHPEYASIWLFRYGWDPYKVYYVSIDKKYVYLSAPETIAEIRFYEPGKHIIWSETGRKEILNIQIELGKDYYVETSFRGLWGKHKVSNVSLYQVSELAGKDARRSLSQTQALVVRVGENP